MLIKINLYLKLKESVCKFEEKYDNDCDFDNLINDVIIIIPKDCGEQFIKKTVIVNVCERKKQIHIKKEIYTKLGQVKKYSCLSVPASFLFGGRLLFFLLKNIGLNNFFFLNHGTVCSV